MFDRRTHLVRATLEKCLRRPYEHGKNDCFAVVTRVIHSISPTVVLPPRPDGTKEEQYQAVIKAGGLIQWVDEHWPENSGLTFSPHVVRAGDVFLHAESSHLLGAYIGVFDASIIPVSWTEENTLEHMTGWPERVWTYG